MIHLDKASSQKTEKYDIKSASPKPSLPPWGPGFAKTNLHQKLQLHVNNNQHGSDRLIWKLKVIGLKIALKFHWITFKKLAGALSYMLGILHVFSLLQKHYLTLLGKYGTEKQSNI